MTTRVGALLNERWSLGVRHALFHKDGTWYHQLRRFPAALCDPNGYVIFRTEREFRTCPHLKIEKDVNLRYHLSDLDGYVRVDARDRYAGR